MDELQFTVSYSLTGIKFTAEATTLSGAYACIEAIIRSSGANFQNPDNALSHFIKMLAKMDEEPRGSFMWHGITVTKKTII